MGERVRFSSEMKRVEENGAGVAGDGGIGGRLARLGKLWSKSDLEPGRRRELAVGRTNHLETQTLSANSTRST
jgi:hypothetical protein